LKLIAGRFFTDAEVAHAAPVIVLGSRLAQELAGVRDGLWLVGRTIRAGGSRREVFGILSSPNSGLEPDLVAFAPIRGGFEILQPVRGRPVATLRLKARSIEAVDTLKLAAENWLADRYGLRAQKLKVEIGTERLENAKQAILLSKLLLGVLVALILAVGGIGIMNVLLAAVVERMKEIGIRKAVGARPRDIHAQFLMESITITGAGSALGFVAGVILAFASTALFRMWAGAPIYPVFKPLTAILAIMSALTVGVVFGTYPARRAARVLVQMRIAPQSPVVGPCARVSPRRFTVPMRPTPFIPPFPAIRAGICDACAYTSIARTSSRLTTASSPWSAHDIR
jgi:putative ABC transport system permease protein